MYSKYLLYAIFIFLTLENHLIKGENSTNATDTSQLTTKITSSTSSTLVTCPEGYKRTSSDTECQPTTQRQDNTTASIKNQVEPSSGKARRLFFLFLGCLLTVLVIFTLIVTYNHVTKQNLRHPSTNTNAQPTITNRFRNLLQSINLNNLRKNGRFNFFSVSNNNYSSGINRQGETSRTHLSENQDEALLFDDPYADGGISGGIHGSTANPYKSLTLSVT